MLRLLAGAFSLAAGLRPEKTLGTSLADSLEHLQGDDECKDLGAEIGEQGSAAWCLCNLDQSPISNKDDCENPAVGRLGVCSWGAESARCLPSTSTTEFHIEGLQVDGAGEDRDLPAAEIPSPKEDAGEKWRQAEKERLQKALERLRTTVEKETAELEKEQKALAEQFEDMRQDQQLLRDFMQSSVDELAEQLLEKNRTLLVYVDQAASAGKNVRQAETSSELDLAAESGTVEAMERQLDVALASLTDLQNSKNALDLEVMEHKSTLADKKSELIQCKVFAANAMDDAKEQIDEDLDEMIESFSSRAAAEAKMETDTAEDLKS